MFEVSSKVARHAWRDHPAGPIEPDWEQQPDRLGVTPERRAEVRDLLALRLDSNRNAVYKTLFDARRKLRASLTTDGHALED